MVFGVVGWFIRLNNLMNECLDKQADNQLTQQLNGQRTRSCTGDPP